MDDMAIHLPISEREFAFNVESPKHVTFKEPIDDPALFKAQSSNRYQYGIIVRGINIWAKIHSYVVNGGRRQPGLMDDN
jgi:hypothetical protein